MLPSGVTCGTELLAHYKRTTAKFRQKPKAPPQEPKPQETVQSDNLAPADPDIMRMVMEHFAAELEEPKGEPIRPPKINDIINIVAKFYDLSPQDIVSHQRLAYMVRPRHVAMFLAKTLTLRSLPEIGRMFAGKDHTTVLHGARKIGRLIGEPLPADPEPRPQIDPELRAAVTELRFRILEARS